MKNLLVIITTFTLTLSAYSSEDCFNKYKESLKSKSDRYEKAYKRYKNRRSAAQSAVIQSSYSGSLTAGGLLGSAVLQNDSPPKKDDYNMYEKDIVELLEFDLNSKSRKPEYFHEIYNEAYENYSNVTYQRIQNLVLKGMQSGRFCGFFGKHKPEAVKKYVLKELKRENSDAVYNRSPAVNSDSQISKEDTYSEEIEKPTEKIIRGIDE